MSTVPNFPLRLATPFAEFCKQIGIGRTKGYDEVRKGALVVRKIGKRSVVTAEDGQRYLEGLRRLELSSES